VGVDKSIWVLIESPLPFTLLDKFFIRPRSSTNILSNRVNPLPRWGGEFLTVGFRKMLEMNSQT
jgi:hypothetical protein